ncbi:MAG: S8 family serine peptidase [Arcanobacterium sp.]|nr:S8 family serine peptidase [Arcanobacterium sp.]
MKPIKNILAGVAAFSLVFGGASAAYAIPDAPALPSTNDSSSVADEPVKVFIALKQQPVTPGGRGANLAAVQNLSKTLSSKYGLDVEREFGYLVNGFSAYVQPEDITRLRLEPGIASVQKVRMYYPTMDSAGELTQATQASEKYGLDGSGLVISIIDTGIDIHHQDMQLDPGVAKKLTPSAGFTEKVPFGYNYADNNKEVKDLTSSHHGMHVAGIAGANAGAGADVLTNGRVSGIAPNAQLLAMKVFSNDPAKAGGAAGDDIIAAIEDSVKQGADIINMSLGSPNGNEADVYGEQRAIAAARAAGVEVIVAAGNEGLNASSSTDPNDLLGMLDDATVGSPSTGTDAWSVASIENSTIVQLQGDVTGNGSTEHFVYDLQVGESDGQAHQIVDGGYGTIDDMFAANPRGKWVLIQRGGAPGTDPLSFADKFANATINGATGVIIYNHANGGDEIPGMAGIDKFTVPGAAIGHSDGLKILQKIQADPNTTVTLSGTQVVVANPEKLHPSAFTSWGATPELGFKPQIAGIGGQVYAQVNDNKYATKSGTSMAAPHVAGVMALMLQQSAKDFPNLSRAEQIIRSRTALSNTAEIPMVDDVVPHAPRQIGAGLVQVQDAINTRVLATVENKPVAELREVKGSETFTVTLKNESATAQTFETGATCVVNESNPNDGSETTTNCSANDSIVASASTVTVPANGTATVDFTLTVSAENHWVEGWVKLNSKSATQPDLNIPYLGFAGDWNAEPIVDYPAYDGFPTPVLEAVGRPTHTSLYTMIRDGEMTLRNGEQFFSPNEDTYADVIYARLAMLRNAEKLTVSIHDAQGNKLRDIGSLNDVTRFTIADQLGERPNTFQEDLSGIAFNGRIYNPDTKQFELLPDGNYIYRVSAQIGADWAAQTLDMPFGIDTVAPEIEVVSIVKNDDDNYEVKVKVTDEFSGVNAVQGRFTWPASVVSRSEDPVDDVYTVVIPGGLADMVGYFELYASDTATNVIRKTIMLGDNALIVESAETLNSSPTINATAVSDQTDELLVQDGKLVLTGRASEQIKQVRIGDVVVDVPENGRWEIAAPVVDGENTVVVEGLDAAGNPVASQTFKFVYDGQPPVIEITTPAVQPATPENGKIRIEGKVTDNISKISTVNIGWDQIPVNEDGTFSAEIELFGDETSLTVRAFDGAWNRGEAVIKLVNDSVPPANLTLNANLGFDRSFNVVSADNEAVTENEDGTYTFLYKGKFNRVPGYFEVDGKQVAVNSDGTFEVPLTLKQGITKFNVTIDDPTYKVSTALKVLFDVDAPGLELTKPEINPDGAIYLQTPGDIEFSGTVWDNAFGYNLTLNGDTVESFISIDDPTAAANRREFKATVPGVDGQSILLGLYDQLDNAYLQLIPVIVDGELPTVTFSGAQPNEVVEKTRVIKALVKDDHLASATFYLDGKLVETKAVELTVAPGADSVVQGQPNRIGADGSALNGTLRDTANAASSLRTVTAQGDSATDSTVTPAEDQPQTTPATATDAAKTGEGYTELTFTVPTPLANGEHLLRAVGVDKAGNLASAELPFIVNEPPVIKGPNTLTLDPDKGDLAKQILAALKITDDAEGVTATVDTSQLVLGKAVEVTVYARDAQGKVTAKKITVTLEYPERTVTADGVSYTAQMPKATELKVTRTNMAGGQKIGVSGAPTNDAGKWLVQAPRAVAEIYYIGADGKRVKVKFSYSEAGYAFVAPANGVIELVYLADPKLDAVDKAQSAKAGVKAPGGALSHTGAQVTTIAVLAIILVSLGATAVLRRRREL